MKDKRALRSYSVSGSGPAAFLSPHRFHSSLSPLCLSLSLWSYLGICGSGRRDPVAVVCCTTLQPRTSRGLKGGRAVTVCRNKTYVRSDPVVLRARSAANDFRTRANSGPRVRNEARVAPRRARINFWFPGRISPSVPPAASHKCRMAENRERERELRLGTSDYYVASRREMPR